MSSVLALQKLAAPELDGAANSWQSLCCQGSTASNQNCCNMTSGTQEAG